MSFWSRWISGGSLWVASRLARIFSLTRWLWFFGFQGQKRGLRMDVEHGRVVGGGQGANSGQVDLSERPVGLSCHFVD